jgi:hypothetical protein
MYPNTERPTMSDVDPFAPEPDPADTPAPAQYEEPRPENAKARPEVDVSQPDFHPVKVTLKGGKDYDAPWLTHHFTSIDEAHEALTGQNASLFAETLKALAKVGRFFSSQEARPSAPSGGGNTSSGGSSGGGSQRRSSPPRGATEAPAWMGQPPTCHHGTWKYVTKERADGSRWHAWGCPGPKGNSCEGLEFVNPPKN